MERVERGVGNESDFPFAVLVKRPDYMLAN